MAQNSTVNKQDVTGFQDSVEGVIFPDYEAKFRNNSIYVEVNKLCNLFDFTNKSAINLIHINCRSLKKNFNDILTMLNIISSPFTAIAVTETWLTPFTQHLYSIPGYTFVSQSRDDKTGGGVGIFINNRLSFTLRSDLCHTGSFIEYLFVNISFFTKKGKFNLLLGCIYRPPNSDISSYNSEIINILKLIERGKYSMVLIAGDYNLDVLKYHSHTPTADFVNNMLSYSFFPVIRNPTRICDTSRTCIDNIFINKIQYNISSCIIYSDVSDHLPIAVHIETDIISENCHNRVIRTRTYDQQSIERFIFDLAKQENWYDVYYYATIENDTTLAYNSFYDVFKVIFNKHFPERLFKLNHKLAPRHSWMTRGLVRSCIKKSKLYKIWKNNGDVADKLRYIAYQNKLKKLLRVAEKSYFFDKFRSLSGDLRGTWKVLGSILNKSTPEDFAKLFVIDGVDVTDRAKIVEVFNDYFIGIGSNLAAAIPKVSVDFSYYLKTSYSNSFALYPTDSNEIINIVSDLQNKMSSGFDEIPVKILKLCINSISDPLSTIINSSMQTGTFPDMLKIARVCPLFKGGDKKCIQNYRPISILSSFSKVFEKIIFRRLLKYLDFNNILCGSQYGFRKGYSTYMSLIEMYHKVSEAIDRNEYCIGVFIDLAKAFDTLDHKILLAKLEHYGVRGLALQWFKSYLSDRKQYVIINGVSSELKNVSFGVPQGSILGPLLFILYINDVSSCSELLSFILFADDTNLFFSSADISHLFSTVNLELSRVYCWFSANKLSLNAKKTNYIIFGNKCVSDKQFNLMIDGNFLERVEHCKFLGVYIDSKLSWKMHINHVALQISKGLGAIGRVRHILPKNALLLLYSTMILPYLSYCNIVWGSARPTVLNKLVTLQKRAVRLIVKARARTPSGPLFAVLNLLKLVDINHYQIVQFMFKVKHCLLPASCMSYVTVSNSFRLHDTRRIPSFNVERFRTIIRECSISIRGPRLWDLVPKKIQESITLYVLKKQLFAFYVHSYF